MARTDQENGELGGRPKGSIKACPLTPDEVAQATAAALVSGRAVWLKECAQLGPVRQSDVSALARLTGWTPAEFNAKLAEYLQVIAFKTAQWIDFNLEHGLYKPNELTFLFAVMEDKRARLDGRSQITQSVNVQINNFAAPQGMSRKAVMSSLRQLDDPRAAEP